MAKRGSDMTAEEIAAADEAAFADIDNMNGHANGKDIEALADEGLEDEPEERYIEGTSGQLSLSVGGRKPDGATFKMKGAEVKVQGQYPKGETVVLKVIARIDDVTFRDMHDEYGTTTATKRIHIAKPISVERVEDEGEID